jgi:hypothetical protein
LPCPFRGELSALYVLARTGEVRTCPAITRPTGPVSARYPSETEGILIADELILGLGVRAIAAGLGHAPSTISREIRRNRDAGIGAYHPYRAQRRAAAAASATGVSSSGAMSSSGRSWPTTSNAAGARSRSAGCCRDCSRTGSVNRVAVAARVDRLSAAPRSSCPRGDRYRLRVKGADVLTGSKQH